MLSSWHWYPGTCWVLSDFEVTNKKLVNQRKESEGDRPGGPLFWGELDIASIRVSAASLKL